MNNQKNYFETLLLNLSNDSYNYQQHIEIYLQVTINSMWCQHLDPYPHLALYEVVWFRIYRKYKK